MVRASHGEVILPAGSVPHILLKYSLNLKRRGVDSAQMRVGNPASVSIIPPISLIVTWCTVSSGTSHLYPITMSGQSPETPGVLLIIILDPTSHSLINFSNVSRQNFL